MIFHTNRGKTMQSTDDNRTTNNVMRHNYRILTDFEKTQMQAIKDKGLELWGLLDQCGQSREASLAKNQG